AGQGARSLAQSAGNRAQQGIGEETEATGPAARWFQHRQVMPFHFQKHYTLEEARALLPKVREWLAELHQLRERLKKSDDRIGQMIAGGSDAGGAAVNAQVKLLADVQNLVQEFTRREIQIKDLERGLIDFPAIIAGKEV